MKQVIENTVIQNEKDWDIIEVQLECETLTDSSQVYNVHVRLSSTFSTTPTWLVNTDCTSKRQAMAKYNAVVKALNGFELS